LGKDLIVYCLGTNHPIALLPNYLITQLPNYPITKLPNHQLPITMNRQDKKKRKNKRNRTKKRPWYLFLIIGMIILSSIFLFGNHGLIRYFQLERRKQELVQQITALKQEQERLQKEIEMLQNNYRYIEKIAREKYQMGKDGEKIYFMIQPVDNDKDKK
jgi:cell division protein FtsL